MCDAIFLENRSITEKMLPKFHLILVTFNVCLFTLVSNLTFYGHRARQVTYDTRKYFNDFLLT